MSVILFKKAKANIDIALRNVEDPDDYVLQLVANNVQQGIEKTLKYALEQYGREYPKTHSIGVLLKSFPEEQTLLSAEDFEFLEDRADTLRLWESDVRYDTDYMATRRQVCLLLDYACKLYERVDTWVAERCAPSNFPPQVGTTHLTDLKLD